MIDRMPDRPETRRSSEMSWPETALIFIGGVIAATALTVAFVLMTRMLGLL